VAPSGGAETKLIVSAQLQSFPYPTDIIPYIFKRLNGEVVSIFYTVQKRERQKKTKFFDPRQRAAKSDPHHRLLGRVIEELCIGFAQIFRI